MEEDKWKRIESVEVSHKSIQNSYNGLVNTRMNSNVPEAIENVEVKVELT